MMRGVAKILSDQASISALAARVKRVAFLGIKPDSLASQPAHYVPARCRELGVEVVPVPTRYPEVSTVLGIPVERDLRRVGEVDLVCVFRRPDELEAHLPDLLALAPPAVWLQSGISHPGFEAALMEAGIDVVVSRCLMVERERGAR